jgi:hypothetical protein
MERRRRVDEPKKLDIALTILLGCSRHRAALLFHIQRCDSCRLAFQQVIDRMLDDCPRELRPRVSAYLRERLEDPEVQAAQSKLQEVEDQHYADPSNRPN